MTALPATRPRPGGRMAWLLLGLLAVAVCGCGQREDHTHQLDAAAMTWPIAGLDSDHCPQGAGYLAAREWVLQSSYDKRSRTQASLVFAIDRSGQVVRRKSLAKLDGSPLVGHVGGLAAWEGWIWICSDGRLWRFPMAQLLGENEVMTADAVHDLDSRASCLSADQNGLWVGEFYRPGSGFGIARAHTDQHGKPAAWGQHYPFDRETGEPAARNPQTGQPLPDRIVILPREAQGIAVAGDVLIVSRSWSDNFSHLLAGRLHPLTTLPSGETLEGWRMGETTRTDLPLGAEDLFVHQDLVGVTFERGWVGFADHGRNVVREGIALTIKQLTTPRTPAPQ